MIAVHSAAIDSRVAAYHEFLLRYSKGSKVVYGFVEGKEDPSFYRGFIELLIPEGWDVELWPAGSKTQVYRIHDEIDWRRFKKARVCFFVDRDLSGLIPERLRSDVNIYVTDGYSIENSVVNRGTCRRILSELCGFTSVPHGELDAIAMQFEGELELFLRAMVPVMAWILTWRRGGVSASLDNIAMRDLFALEKGRIRTNPISRQRTSLTGYLHERCGIAHNPAVDIEGIEVEFGRRDVYRTLTRGKYVFWFMIEFCVSVHRDASHFFPGLSKAPKMHVTLSPSGGIAVVGPRARVPSSLRTFLEATFCAYTRRVEGRADSRS